MPGEAIVDVEADAEAIERVRRRRRFRLAIALLFVSAVIGAIVGAAFLLRQEGREAALLLADQVLDAAQSRVADEVASFLDPATRALAIAAGLLGDDALGDDEDLAVRFAAGTLRQLPQITLFSFADRDGNYLMVRREADGSVLLRRIFASGGPRRVTLQRLAADGTLTELGTEPDNDFDPRTRPWFQGAPERGVGWTGIYVFFTERVPGLTASVRAGNGGVFGADITLADLSRKLADLRLGRSGRGYIVDRQGRLIAGPDPAQVLTPDGTATRPVEAIGDTALLRAWDESRFSGASRRLVTLDGVSQVLWSTPVGGQATGWTLLIVVPEEEFSGALARWARGSLLLLGGIVVLTILLAIAQLRQGFATDRALRRAEAAEQATLAQAQAWQALADAMAGDHPIQQAAAAIGAATGADRVSIWRIDPAQRRMVAEDLHEAGGQGHVSGAELHRADAPRAFAALAANETLDEAARAELARAVPDSVAGRPLTAVTLRRRDALVGLLLIEGAQRLPRGLIQAAAAQLGQKLVPLPTAAPVPEPVAAVTGEAPRQESDLLPPDLAPDQVAADVHLDVAVVVLRFGDASTLAAKRGDGAVADAAARLLQKAAARHAIPYLKVMGTEVTACAGFGAPDTGAPGRLAAFAHDVRSRLEEVAEDLGRSFDLRFGMDVGLAIGGTIGGAPTVFNLWGEAVRNAAMMAATAPPGTIQATDAARARIGGRFLFRPRGAFWMPRAGEVRTFLLTGPA